MQIGRVCNEETGSQFTTQPMKATVSFRHKPEPEAHSVGSKQCAWAQR